MSRMLILALLMVMAVVVQSGLASALTSLYPLEESYRLGDYVELGAVFTNNYTDSKLVEIEQVLLHDELLPLLVVTSAYVEPGQIAIVGDIGFTAEDETYPGSYTYIVTVYENDVPIESANISFGVINPKKSFDDIRLRICTGPECEWFRIVFTLDTTAYMKVFDSEGARLTGYIEDRLGFRKGLDFKGDAAEFRPGRAGRFMARVLAEKLGYESYEMETEFYVIEGNVVLTNPLSTASWMYYLAAIIAVCVVVAALVFIRSARKRGEGIDYLLRPAKRP